MKKVLLKTFAVLAVLPVAFSCNKEVTQTPAPEPQKISEREQTEEKLMTLTATIGDITKVAVDDAGKMTWDATDAIHVYFSNGENRKFTIKSGAGTANAVFEGAEVGGATASFALYPYSDLSPSLSGTTLSLTLPNGYDLRGGKHLKVPMFGKLKNGTNFNFTHLGGIIRFNFKGFPSTGMILRFTSNNRKITGTYNIDTEAAIPELTATDGSSEINIGIDAPGTYGKDAAYDVFVPTGTYDDFSVRIFDGSWLPITQTATVKQAANVVTRKKLLVMPTVDMRPIHEDFESAGWSSENTSRIENPVSTSVNGSSYVIDATAYFSFNIDYKVGPFDGLRDKGKVLRIKYYAGENAGNGFPALRVGSGNPYVLPARVNGSSTGTYLSNDWNIVEWDWVPSVGGNTTIRPFTDASGTALSIPAGSHIYIDDIEVLL